VTWWSEWAADVTSDLVAELVSDVVDQSWIDTCSSTRANERVPHGPTRGRHVAPPYYIKVCLDSAGVEPATSGSGQVFA